MRNGPRRGAHTIRRMLLTAVGCAVCVAAICAAVLAQPPAKTGSLTGRLTDLRSHPVSGATVVLRDEVTGREARALTASNGAYRFSGLEPGTYALIATSPAGAGEVNGIVIASGFQARVSAAVAFHALAKVAAAPESKQPGDSETRSTAPAPAEASRLRDLIQAAQQASADRLTPGTDEPDVRIAGTRIESALLTSLPIPARAAAFAGAALRIPKPAVDSEALATESAGVSATLDAVPMANAALVVQPIAAVPELGSTSGAPKQVEIATDLGEPHAAITGEELQALPLKSRDWSAFAIEQPQRVPRQTDEDADETGGEPLPSARGEMRSGSVFTTQTWRKRGGAVEPVPEAAVSEVRPAGGTDAELREPSQTTVETRRGGNELHGQAFVFDRHNVLGAHNPFTQWVKETSPATASIVPQFAGAPYSPGDQRTTWGIGLGSRLPRRLGAWFAALDGDHRAGTAVATPRHPEDLFAQPTDDELQQLSARLRLSPAYPVAEGLQAYSNVLEQLAALMGPVERSSTIWTGFGRLDMRAGERQRVSIEATATDWNATGGGLTRVSEPYGSHSFGSPKSSLEWLLGRWEVFLTPNLLATTAGAFRRQSFAPEPQKPSAFENSLLANLWGQLPQIVVDSSAGFTIGNPARFGVGTYPQDRGVELQQRVDWVRGTLLMKSGFEYRHNANATSLLRNRYGTYVYSRPENFVSDVLAFENFGLADALDPQHPHNCDERGRAWRDAAGKLHGMGYLPCYSYYTQTLGPNEWHLSTNDWAGWATTQWQPAKSLVVSAAVRWEREEAPPPIALVDNPELPLTESMPKFGNQWAPRASLAWGIRENHWPVLRVGYGAYYGRTNNAVVENVLTQTGSLKGDLRHFVRPTDMLAGGNAPPFPYVFAGLPGSAQKPSALEFAARFRNPEIHQGEVSVEESLPGHVSLSVAAMASLGRRLPMVQDTNIDAATNPGVISYAVVDTSGKGPIKKTQLTVPFYGSWPAAGNGGRLLPNYQQISQLESRANSTYEAMQVQLVRAAAHGVTVRARYTWGQAWDWNPDESSAVMGSSVFDPANLALENGRSDLDVRHSLSGWLNWDTAWKHSNERWWARGWNASVLGNYRSGLPFTMRTAGALPELSTANGGMVVALGSSMNGYGGDNRVYGVGRNTFRYPAAWKADVRFGRRIALGRTRELEMLAESFNLFNHQNVTQLEAIGYTISHGFTAGSLPTLNYRTGAKSGQAEFGKSLNVNGSDFYRERQLDFGLRLRFRVALTPEDWDY